MRKMVTILVLLLVLPSSLAYGQPNSWSNLDRLKPGQRIEVIESGPRKHAGEFTSVNDESLTLKEHGSDFSIKRENVVRISRSSGSSRGEHAVIGLVIGGLVGAGIGAASGSSTGFFISPRGIGALVGVAIGGSIGAIVGVLLPAHKTIYRAAQPSTSH